MKVAEKASRSMMLGGETRRALSVYWALQPHLSPSSEARKAPQHQRSGPEGKKGYYPAFDERTEALRWQDMRYKGENVLTRSSSTVPTGGHSSKC